MRGNESQIAKNEKIDPKMVKNEFKKDDKRSVKGWYGEQCGAN